MLHETVDGLNIRPGGVYVDATFGGGGHSREALCRLGYDGRLYAFDQDADAMQNIPEEEGRLTFIQSNFRWLRNWMHYYGVEHIDGLLADLGVSSHHFDTAERGFSFRYDGALDMRMNRSAKRTAVDVVNGYTVERLDSILRLYGEVRNPGRMARMIEKARADAPILTTGRLTEVLTGNAEPGPQQKKEMARVFQALRIEVNDEMAALRQMLEAATELLAPGGRLVVLTYHSLEDRIVKNLMKTGNVEGRVEQDFYGRNLSPLHPLGKAMTATAAEQDANPRSRSAKLRIAEKGN